jgi:hypothetical protein
MGIIGERFRLKGGDLRDNIQKKESEYTERKERKKF